MAEIAKDMFRGMPWYLFLVIILAFGLIVASFLVPPLGVIQPSVLQGVGILLGFTWLFYTTANIPVFIERGAKIHASYGNAKIEIGKRSNEVQLSQEPYGKEKEEGEDYE